MMNKNNKLFNALKFILSLAFLLSFSDIAVGCDMTAIDESLLEHARNYISSSNCTIEPKSDAEKICYRFVDHLLSQESFHHAWEELKKSHTYINDRLPSSHQAEHIIPYHYHLISLSLKTNGLSSQYWSSPPIEEAIPGDLFIYIDPLYDPDPSQRKARQPSGTHIAVIDAVLKDKGTQSLRLIDASQRLKGRSKTPFSFEDTYFINSKASGIAYSYLHLEFLSKEYAFEFESNELCQCRFPSQKSVKRYCSLLRLHKKPALKMAPMQEI